MAETLGTICTRCQAPANSSSTRLPRGWKSTPLGVLCKTCVGTAYLHRATTVPIAGPVDATWAEFGAALREAWTATTACANWIVTALYVRDVRRTADMRTLPPMVPVYLYPEARAAFPQISPINLTALLQQVEQTYRRQRYELLWTGGRSLAVHRYPVPTPVHAQAWRLDPPDPGNGWMTVHVRLGDRWWALRLRGGREFAIQRTQLLQLQTGVAIGGAGALLAIRAHTGDHRHQETRQRVLLKLTGWFPRPDRTGAVGACRVSTAASDLLLIRHDGRLVAPIAGTELRRVIRSYEVRRRRGHLRSDRVALRIKTMCQQIAAQVATIAAERGVATVEYEDETRDFCDPFPWTKFRLWLQSAVEGRGLQWSYLSGDPLAKEPSHEVAAC